MQSGPADQVFCPRCKGGNPPVATVCMWCNQPLLAPLSSQQHPPGEVDAASVQKVREKIQQILSKAEQIEYIAVESKPVQINIAPDCVVLTNRRFIIYRPKVLGRVDFEDYIWRDLRDARLTEGMLRATFEIDTEDGRHIAVTDLPKEQARRVYQYAQQMEEYVLEERRMREMEEKRAASGGIYMQGTGMPNMSGMPPMQAFQSSPPPTIAPTSPQQESPVEKLKQLKEMLDAGLITSDIYDAKRTEILSKM